MLSSDTLFVFEHITRQRLYLTPTHPLTCQWPGFVSSLHLRMCSPALQRASNQLCKQLCLRSSVIHIYCKCELLSPLFTQFSIL